MIPRRVTGALILAVSVLLLFGSFRGPYAFVRRPTMILAPLYAPSFEVDEIAEMRLLLERELAAEGSHSLYPKSLIENFYLERDNAVDVFDGDYLGKDEAFALGEGLGVERVAIATILQYSDRVNATLTVHDLATEQVVGSATLKTSDLESLLNWQGIDGQALDLAAELGITVPGLSVGAWLFIGWLILLGISGILMIAALEIPRIFLEGLLAAGLLLALFSWIYALNGDMDYVQRFVATSGVLSIDDTRAERNATLVRYLTPMILLGFAWILDLRLRIRRGQIDRVDLSAPAWGLCSAILYSLALPNFLVLEGIPLFAWIATAPLYIALRRVRFGRGFGLMVFFTGLQSLLVNWWQGTFSYVSLPFTVGLTLVQYLPFALLLVFTVRRFPRLGLWAAPLLWTAFDWIRSLGFLGYPWGLLGVSQYSNPGLIQIASFGGVWVVSLLTHLSGAVIAHSIERALASPHREVFRFGRAVWLPLAGMAAVVLLTTIGGRIAINARDRSEAGRSVKILLVQQNTDPRKHDYHLSFDELSRLTEAALAEHGSFDLVAWPESGFVPDVRFWLDEGRAKWRRGKLVRSFLDWQSEIAMPLVTGTQDHFYEPAPPSDDPEAPEEVKRIQNSSMYLPPDRKDDSERHYYYKIRLVPFTENFPYREEFPWVAELLHNFSTTQWTPGTLHIVQQAPSFRFSTPICFEDVFPDHVRRFVVNGAEVLVNMSNDYWANTPLEGYQHAAHAIFRAVENRRPLVRATCSGWTISVDTEGRIADGWPEFYTPGALVAEHVLPDTPKTTIYTRFGDWFPVLTLILWVVFLAWETIMRVKTRSQTGNAEYLHLNGSNG